ncbi:hypothetical protein LWC34_51560 [Kibdelosporangium philippinense]|uniref:Uncharacterized protein n=1 Tax=Kibdelosporangium philippinense TaxID=211113 RepID=A0ABS8ZU23_9PSEU|nr:hypothetical protein [Kibdelosporangium philippinense]MCE7011192.1 hypothetical protein [Kibdelosporangium philippinense]
MNAAEVTEDRLRQLIERGFKFVHPRDESGDITAIVGVRPHDNVIDVVQLRTEDDAVALRLAGDTKDVLAPEKHSWRSAGPAPRVLDELLNLPDVIAETAVPAQSTSNGCWIHTDKNRAKWVPAS